MIKSDNFTSSNREKSNIAIAIGKINDWMATYLFRILVVTIIFSPTVCIHACISNHKQTHGNILQCF